jgi:hypothetical protein
LRRSKRSRWTDLGVHLRPKPALGLTLPSSGCCERIRSSSDGPHSPSYSSRVVTGTWRAFASFESVSRDGLLLWPPSSAARYPWLRCACAASSTCVSRRARRSRRTALPSVRAAIIPQRNIPRRRNIPRQVAVPRHRNVIALRSSRGQGTCRPGDGLTATVRFRQPTCRTADRRASDWSCGFSSGAIGHLPVASVTPNCLPSP